MSRLTSNISLSKSLCVTVYNFKNSLYGWTIDNIYDYFKYMNFSRKMVYKLVLGGDNTNLLLHKHILYTEFNNIIELSISNTSITCIQKEIFPHLISLKVLDLSFNKIRVVNKNSFRLNYNLKTIKLNNNRIKCIYNDTFYYCTSLQNLYLNNNNIVNIRPNSFRTINTLKLLDIRFNQIPFGTPQCLILQLVKSDVLLTTFFEDQRNVVYLEVDLRKTCNIYKSVDNNVVYYNNFNDSINDYYEDYYFKFLY